MKTSVQALPKVMVGSNRGSLDKIMPYIGYGRELNLKKVAKIKGLFKRKSPQPISPPILAAAEN